MVEKIKKIEFASKKRGTLYKTGSQYTTKKNITKGEAKSQVSKNSFKNSIEYTVSSIELRKKNTKFKFVIIISSYR